MNIGVVGGGLTGLATGFQLLQAGHTVTVYEASGNPGGVIHSKHRDGFVLEQGAASAQGASREVYQLFIDAGLAEAVLPASEAADARYLFHEGRLVALPSSLKDLLATPGLGRRGALRLIQEPFRRGHVPPEESVHDFLSRRVGPRAAEALGDPLMAGIFAGDPRRVEVNSAFPQWVEWERTHGSLALGSSRHRTTPPRGLPTGTLTLRGGLGTLTERLAEHLGDRLLLHAPVARLSHTRTTVSLGSPRGENTHDHVVITTPQHHARQLLADAPSGWLEDLPIAPIAAIHLAYAPDAIPDGLPGFGWLAHSAQRRDALGCLWVSGAFPDHAPTGAHLLRIIVGGTRAPQMAQRTDEALVHHARRLLAEAQQIEAEPLFTEVNRASVPQYPLGFARRLRLLGQMHPRIQFAGWSWGHLGVAASILASSDIANRLRGR